MDRDSRALVRTLKYLVHRFCAFRRSSDDLLAWNGLINHGRRYATASLSCSEGILSLWMGSGIHNIPIFILQHCYYVHGTLTLGNQHSTTIILLRAQCSRKIKDRLWVPLGYCPEGPKLGPSQRTVSWIPDHDLITSGTDPWTSCIFQQDI
jgi:hypothetical protein